MSNCKVKMPELAADVRNKCFEEVALGYSREDAVAEAKRCLNCKHRPCVSGCPVNVNIPEFINLAAEGKFEEAYEVIAQTNSLPAVCGRVCPQENQCEGKCVRGIKGEAVGIGRLERFCADYHRENANGKATEKKTGKAAVAVIGSGPAGLTCAGDLAKLGYDVSVFEAFHTAGGVLVYGIPEFRLPKEIVSYEIEGLKSLGVKIITDTVVGKTVSVDELFEEGFKACFIGTGAGLPSFMGIEGEALAGVLSANEYLTRINLMKAYIDGYDTPINRSKNTAVIGGGNVAMDAARCAKRLGCENVYIVYRRGFDEMPARAEEIHHAKEEGIIFENLAAPARIIGKDGNAEKIECIRMALGEPDESGRRRPEPVKDSNFIIEADTVILAIGSSPNPLIRTTTDGLEVNRRGCIVVDEQTMRTSREGIYAGGDAVTGAATVIQAMGAGKLAAAAIDEYLQKV